MYLNRKKAIRYTKKQTPMAATRSFRSRMFRWLTCSSSLNTTKQVHQAVVSAGKNKKKSGERKK